MWEYVVLSALARGKPGTQRALAQAIGYDKTRLIALLDRLHALGLVVREPDPADRRARQARLTDAGRARHAAIRTDIRAMEEELLRELEGDQRRTLRGALARLAGPRA
jgi:DNA-binding MarR family transcriptional regulator